MSKQRINVGTGINTGTGDTLRAAMEKVNNNFDELYDLAGQDSTGKAIDISGNTISSTFTNTDITISPNGTGNVVIDGDLVTNIIKSDDSTGVIIDDNLILTGTIKADSSTLVRIAENVEVTGTLTATSFSGDGSALTGIASTGNITFSESSISTSDSTQININENLNVDGNIIMGDSDQIQLGDSGDLKIFHNGSHSIVRETGTGNLFLQSDNNVILSKDTGTETMVKGIADGAVELYHDNTKTFETTATGVIVGAADTNAEITTQGTGDLTLSTNSGTNSGTIKIADGTNGDITIENDGTGDILLKAGGQVGIGSVSSPDTSLHVKTAAAKVTLQRTADANTPGISFQQSGGNVRAEFMMDGTSGTSNTLFFKTHDGASLSERFRVIHTGVSVTGNIDVSGATVFTPQDDLATSTTALSLSKTVHSLAAGEQNYTLAAGTEGQIMHFIIAGGDSVAGSVANTTVTISQVRNPDDGDVLPTYAWKLFTTPFGAGDSVEPRRSLATCIFGNGAWNLDIYSN
jgi:hypothetical protein